VCFFRDHSWQRHDDEARFARGSYDDVYGYNADHEAYYDQQNYIRIAPHILCTPVLAEFPKLYSDKNEMEDILYVAVSYYMDEDEYQGMFSYKRFDSIDRGDETEARRGLYVASAIMAYSFGKSLELRMIISCKSILHITYYQCRRSIQQVARTESLRLKHRLYGS
jgi:hypothetical protein